MKESGKNQEIDNLIQEEMKNAFGYGKNSLIAEFDEASGQLDESDHIPPEGEFQKISAKVHEFEKKQKKSSKNVVRLKRVGKVGLLVAILGCVLMGTGIGASGKRAYEYSIKSPNEGNSVWNNTANLESKFKVDEAYQDIHDKLGIDVLKLLYIPEEMKFTKLSFGDGYARMEFTCNNQYIYFIQSQDPVENSGSTASDCKEGKSVYNKVLKMDLPIKENLLKNKTVELSTEFSIDKTYYHVAGVLSEEDFVDVLERIN